MAKKIESSTTDSAMEFHDDNLAIVPSWCQCISTFCDWETDEYNTKIGARQRWTEQTNMKCSMVSTLSTLSRHLSSLVILP